ncbi:hypothetical protein [Marinifilum caeruleilacunae]|uniref:DUF4468 domain-containing protein n=1 Tax=Marinifilum caeruleilacunae TaxID=2499076 RepID=A0ABX1WTW4_9BACT|nr:hypothetical protein [Marinifilum caeruleilacunae]NOU59532.1 hypothetical protein [Marinifilum caeruleilacunae]
MKKIFCTFIVLSIVIIAIGQNQADTKLSIDDNTAIKMTSSIQISTHHFAEIRNWVLSSEALELEMLNSNTGEANIKGCNLIYLSEKQSSFQTQMHYTLRLKEVNNQLLIEIKDVYYMSLPVYGKQGTPSVISYPSDWFSNEKLHKKSGKERYLNAIVKKNTIAKMKEVMNSALVYLN